MQQMMSWPRTTPDSPRSIRASSTSKLVAPARPHERPEEAAHALAREHQVRREHQRDAEDEDGATHAGDDVATARAISSALCCAYANALADGVGHDPVGVERLSFLDARGLEHPPLFAATTLTPLPTSIAIDPSACGRATNALAGAASGGSGSRSPGGSEADGAAAGRVIAGTHLSLAWSASSAAPAAGSRARSRCAARSPSDEHAERSEDDRVDERSRPDRATRFRRSTHATSGVSTYAMTSARTNGSITSRAATITATAMPRWSRETAGRRQRGEAARRACACSPARARLPRRMLARNVREVRKKTSPGRVEVLGHDARVGEDRHEVRVAGPARNDVRVQMVGDPGARGLARG